MPDSLVKCTVCGREENPSFAGSLRNGWPKCCGYTMRLLRTDADIERAAACVITAQHADFDATAKGLEAESAAFPSSCASLGTEPNIGDDR